MAYDVIIVGGGPAGLSAALYALRAEKTVLVLEKNNFGGQIAWSPRVENYPGIQSVSGAALTDILLSQVLDLGGECDLTEVFGITDHGEEKTVRTADGDVNAKAVILATGARHRHLGLPREEELIGNGICYCAVCDGAFYKGRPVAVVGGGDAALQDALLLSGSCSEVYIIHRRNEFRAEAANVKAVLDRQNIHLVLSARVEAFLGEKELRGITVYHSEDASRSQLAVAGLFVAVGYQPENTAFAELAKLDAAGWFASGEDCLTRSPGIFAAGDCRAKAVRQLTTAVGDGAVAAMTAVRYIDGLSK